jgi:opine dehydrogenase
MSEPVDTIAVIGAGNGGTAIAAHILSMKGNVNLCDLFPEYLKDIQEAGYINLNYNGTDTKVKPSLVTSNIGEAIKGVKIIMIVTPAFTHKMIAEACSEFLEDGQIIILNPGRTAGALEFLNTIRSHGCNKDVIIAETQTLIYSCRKTNGNSVSIYGIKKSVDISSIPSSRIYEVTKALAPYYKQFNPVPNIAWTSFSNIGSMFHPIPVLLNIGRIESDEQGFKYYWEGISPTVAEFIEIVDKERLSVAKAFGADILSAKDWLVKSYDTYGETLYERINNNTAYKDITAPKTTQVRYVIEDVPTGLVAISELAKAVNVQTPNIDAIIDISSSIYKIDFRESGRSLKNLGLEGMSKKAILEYFESGENID